MHKKNIILVVVLLVSMLSQIPGLHAEEFADKGAIKLGGYFITTADTNIRVNPQGGALGTNLNFSKDLGGEDDEAVPRLTGYYRFKNRHRIDYGYYKVDREGNRTLTGEIVIGDVTFPVNTTVITTLNVDVYKLAYTYSFYHNEKVELGISAGLHFMDYEFKAESDDGSLREEADFLAPLPVFGFLMNYNISPAWSAYVHSELFYIELDDTYNGSILDFRLGTEYRVFENVSVGFNINRMSVDADVDDDDFRGSVTDVYKGYHLYAAYYF